MPSTKQRERLNNFDVHETLYQINLSFEDYKYSTVHIRVILEMQGLVEFLFLVPRGSGLAPRSLLHHLLRVSCPRTVPRATVMSLVRWQISGSLSN